MKIASYNIWDSPSGMPHRREQLTDAIAAVGADVLCLQENTLGDAFSAQLPLYCHRVHHPEYDLSVLSRFPITESYCLPYALAVRIRIQDKAFCIVNLHLPWESALQREETVVAISKKADEIRADYTFLCGDFNCTETSSVQRFLCAEQSLHGHDACYFDLALSYAEITESTAEPTLDFRNNPRWGIVQPINSIERNVRFDRILLKNPYPADFPQLTGFGLFGKTVSPLTHLAPSDHWGIYTCLEF